MQEPSAISGSRYATAELIQVWIVKILLLEVTARLSTSVWLELILSEVGGTGTGSGTGTFISGTISG